MNVCEVSCRSVYSFLHLQFFKVEVSQYFLQWRNDETKHLVYIFSESSSRCSKRLTVENGEEKVGTEIQDRGTNYNFYFDPESRRTEVHLSFHYPSFLKRNWLCVAGASFQLIWIRKHGKSPYFHQTRPHYWNFHRFARIYRSWMSLMSLEQFWKNVRSRVGRLICSCVALISVNLYFSRLPYSKRIGASAIQKRSRSSS